VDTTPTLLTVEQFSKRHEAFTPSALRYLIFYSKPRRISVNGTTEVIPGNGFAEATRYVGRRVFLWEERFFDVIEKQNAQRSETS